MKFIEVNPSLLTQAQQFVDANPTTLGGIAVLFGIAGAWIVADWLG